MLVRRARPQLWSCLGRTPSPKARLKSMLLPGVAVRAAAAGRRHCGGAARGRRHGVLRGGRRVPGCATTRTATSRTSRRGSAARRRSPRRSWTWSPSTARRSRRRRRPRWRCRPRRRRRARRRRARRRRWRRRRRRREDPGGEGASVTRGWPIKQTSSFGRRTDSAPAHVELRPPRHPPPLVRPAARAAAAPRPRPRRPRAAPRRAPNGRNGLLPPTGEAVVVLRAAPARAGESQSSSVAARRAQAVVVLRAQGDSALEDLALALVEHAEEAREGGRRRRSRPSARPAATWARSR